MIRFLVGSLVRGGLSICISCLGSSHTSPLFMIEAHDLLASVTRSSRHAHVRLFLPLDPRSRRVPVFS